MLFPYTLSENNTHNTQVDQWVKIKKWLFPYPIIHIQIAKQVVSFSWCYDFLSCNFKFKTQLITISNARFEESLTSDYCTYILYI